MENQEQEQPEDLAQLIARLKDQYKVSDSEIARRIGVAPATVNAWVHRKRGGTRGPNKEKLRALAREFPKFTEAQIFAAAGRKTPGPLDPDARERILALIGELTADQQEMTEIQIRALVERNRSSAS
ncbi:helix-turn-helix domain-containing protein [Streptomyces sp. NBC_01320]|uniref:helix-turn-helix domain-containing protein n=1 Tax=Streptomyces sp. NBC_01320 TaxID=2903824 RepID=UPI002E0F2F29|nr:helix-turn-helix domain-containing protein [Streptomyces sp. NBC_01320]